ncbi:hypothetical protein [Virgibacillus ihumii]|uniref:hypothetical protein n=1 Tax=Virgibacillus ihumii TaxID=2686091 RepID=UPI00157C179E|nr:hypothetical protein [Virgibacillus ihumii]
MLRVHLFILTVTVSVRQPKPETVVRRYEHRLLVDRLVEETKRKRDQRIHM